MRASSARSGPIANGVSVTTIRKNSTPMPRAAADADRELEVAREEGGERGHASPSSRSSLARSSPIGPCAAATIKPPPARCVAHQSGKTLLRRPVERGGRLVEQPDRAARQRPAGRATAAGAGRRTGSRRQIGQGVEADRLQGAFRGLGVSEVAGPEREVLGDRQGRFQRVLVAEVMDLFGQRSVGGRRRPARAAPRRPGPGLRSFAAGRTCRRRCGRSPAGLRPCRPQSRPRKTPSGHPGCRPVRCRKAASILPRGREVPGVLPAVAP